MDFAVLFIGPMRAGKTTAASYCEAVYGAKRYSVSGKLKELYREINQYSLEKDREWLQKHGQAHRKVFGEDFWVNELVKQIEKDGSPSFTVDDIRYENELNVLMDYSINKGKIAIPVFVNVSLENQVIRKAEFELLMHESESFPRMLKNRVVLKNSKNLLKYKGMDIAVLDGNLPIRDYMNEINSILSPRIYGDGGGT